MTDGLSKPLMSADVSGALLSRRALDGDSTYAINVDRIIFDRAAKTFYLIEYQKCDEHQVVTPWTSHPRRYWDKCKRKYMALWRLVEKLGARLYVVNYADDGTPFCDQYKVLEVTSVKDEGIVTKDGSDMNFEKFSEWFRAMNRRGQ